MKKCSCQCREKECVPLAWYVCHPISGKLVKLRNVHIPRIGRDVLGMWTWVVVGDPTICHWSEFGLFPEVGEGGFGIALDWEAEPLGLALPLDLETCAGNRWDKPMSGLVSSSRRTLTRSRASVARPSAAATESRMSTVLRAFSSGSTSPLFNERMSIIFETIVV